MCPYQKIINIDYYSASAPETVLVVVPSETDILENEAESLPEGETIRNTESPAFPVDNGWTLVLYILPTWREH